MITSKKYSQLPPPSNLTREQQNAINSFQNKRARANKTAPFSGKRPNQILKELSLEAETSRNYRSKADPVLYRGKEYGLKKSEVQALSDLYDSLDWLYSLPVRASKVKVSENLENGTWIKMLHDKSFSSISGLIHTPKIELSTGKGPKIDVQIKAKARETDNFLLPYKDLPAPLLLNDVRPWSQAKEADDLGDYQLKEWTGIPNPNFPRTLENFLTAYAEDFNIKDTSPVIDLSAILPIAPKFGDIDEGSFVTEFIPRIHTDDESIGYKCMLVEGNKVSPYTQTMGEGSSPGASLFSNMSNNIKTKVEINSVKESTDGSGKAEVSNFRAHADSDLDNLSKAGKEIPQSDKHMFIIAIPYKREIAKPAFNINDFDDPFLNSRGRGLTKAATFSSSASLGNASFSSGTSLGATKVSPDTLKVCDEAETVIFHLNFQALKPNQIETIINNPEQAKARLMKMSKSFT
ncbi:MAG: hypothetical protein HRT47_10480 [Candidatus Caenarcaniphilales bacterium]|nr:hypothetical protein [Candidatus Caenarcaniphilales bacterium]